MVCRRKRHPSNALAGTVERFGHLDILVNNAGVSQRASVMDLDRATWQQVIDTNLTGAFLCTKYAARHMQAQGAGKIINVSSIYGVVAPSKGLQVAYTVAKHGMIGLTRVMQFSSLHSASRLMRSCLAGISPR